MDQNYSSKKSTLIKNILRIILITIITFSLITDWNHASAKGVSVPAAAPASPTDPFLFKEINPGNGESYPENFTLYKDKMYFQADDGVHGNELWVSDGTITGTKLLLDLNPGSTGSYPHGFTVMGDTLYFAAKDASLDYKIWRSDGTSAGTVQIQGIKTICELFCTNPVSLNNELYFFGGDTEHGFELWKTDGTDNGSMMVKDINPGTGWSDIYSLTAVNGLLFFFADDGIHGVELWKSDGTESGTTLTKDIFPGAGGSIDIMEIRTLVSIGKWVFFRAIDEKYNADLWKSDGTEANTLKVGNIYPGGSSNPVLLTKYDQELFFFAEDGVHGRELWKTDGTAFGTTLVKDIRAGVNGKRGYCVPCEMGPVFKGYLYFEANSETMLQLWRTDGTTDGTTFVMDLAPETDYVGAGSMNKTSVNNLLYTQRFLNSQLGLWIFDGSNPPDISTSQVIPFITFNSEPDNIINGNYFFDGNSTGSGYELWSIPVTTESALDLSLESPNVLKANSPVTYTISYQNSGGTNAANVTLIDTVSSSLHSISYTSSGPAVTLTSTSPYTWQVADLAPGEGGVITISATTNADLINGDLIINRAQLSAQMSDGISLTYTRGKQGMIVDIPPTISDIPNVHTLSGSPTFPIPFKVDDEDTPLEQLTVTAASSNQTLIPDDHIVFHGAGPYRTMVITPLAGQLGSADITITVCDATSTVTDIFTLFVDPYAIYLPAVQNAFAIYIPPGIHQINQCAHKYLYIRDIYAGLLTECVTSIEILGNGKMQFNFKWNIDIADGVPPITKYADTYNTNMYITDNLGNRYDHINVGGAAAEDTTMYDNIPIEGWFLFSPAKKSATTFVFHDADQNLNITNIILVP